MSVYDPSNSYDPYQMIQNRSMPLQYLNEPQMRVSQDYIPNQSSLMRNQSKTSAGGSGFYDPSQILNQQRSDPYGGMTNQFYPQQLPYSDVEYNNPSEPFYYNELEVNLEDFQLDPSVFVPPSHNLDPSFSAD